jgi:hypothetical protein
VGFWQRLFKGSDKPSAAYVETAGKAPPAGEVGISGTANLYGRLYTETNTKLQWEKGYGLPSQLSWGEWEKISRTDASIASALDSVVAGIRDADVSVEPASESEEDQNIAAVVKDNLLDWLDPLWPEFSQQVVRGKLIYGFSLHETINGMRDEPRVPGGKMIFVKRLAQRLPSSVHPNGWLEEKTGDLVTIRQYGLKQDGTWDHNILLPANKVLLCSWNREGNNYSGYSALRPVWYLAKIREELLRIMAIGSEREALGVPIAEQEKDVRLTTQQTADLQTLLSNIRYHENASGILPPGVKMNWVQSKGADKSHVLELWNSLGQAIKEVLQAQHMSSGTGASAGSHAAAQTHQQSLQSFLMGVKANFEAMLNGTGDRAYTGLVARIVRPNWGPLVKLPKVILTPPRPDLDIGTFATAASALVTAGFLTVTLEDENDIREKAGLQKPRRLIHDSLELAQIVFGGHSSLHP